jgi:PKD repeat protein
VAVAGAAAALAFLLLSDAGRSTEASAQVRVLPGNPVAGRAVVLTTSGAELVGTGYRWDFGDGETSRLPAPVHVFREPGDYEVRLTVETDSGPVVASRVVSVSAATTLQLLGGRFDVTLFARDQRTERTGEGLALPENDLFGYFAIPALTNNPDNPEMFIKILDGRVINGQFWVFYNGLTDLDVTLTVRENPTGIVKTYRKEPGSACGGFDTSGFTADSAAPTPTPPSAVPTPTPPTGSQTINVDASPFRYDPGSASPIQVTAGVVTTLNVSSSSGTHGFSGIPELGISGSNNISAGEEGDYGYPGSPPTNHRVTFTAPASARGNTYTFYCTFDSCGVGHTTMTGSLRVN